MGTEAACGSMQLDALKQTLTDEQANSVRVASAIEAGSYKLQESAGHSMRPN